MGNNYSLAVDLYELTMAQVYFYKKKGVRAEFELFIRSHTRPFYVGCGIEEALEYIANLQFSRQDISYLRNLDLFTNDFLSYLSGFKFRGDIFSVNEPEIVFPGEPILRVEANIVEAQIVESIILNTINLAVTLATKAARVVLAAEGKSVYDFSLRRTQGIHASLAAAKYSYLAGAKGTSNCLAGKLYGIPVVGTMAHSYIMSFSREEEAFIAFSRQYPKKNILLVDTYNVKEGIRHAVNTARKLKALRGELLGIRLDSGNLAEDAVYARKVLDREGLKKAYIFASGNLDEYKIKKLLQLKAPIDAFGVGTNMGCSADLPYTDVVYKIVTLKDADKSIVPTMKLSARKATLPFAKQVFRNFNGGKMSFDVIGRWEETQRGHPLLKKHMQKGVIIGRRKTLKQKQGILAAKLKQLPLYLTGIKFKKAYPVKISQKLRRKSKKAANILAERMKAKVIFVDIDTQHDFMDKKGALYVKEAEKIKANLKLLTAFAKKNKITIVSSADTHKKDAPEFEIFGSHCIKHTWGWGRIKETLLRESKTILADKIYSGKYLQSILSSSPQIIIEKKEIDVFSNPNAKRIFTLLSPDKVYVYGVALDYCVKKAVEGLLANNLNVVLIVDATKAIENKEKRKLFAKWRHSGVEFITTAEVLKRVFN